MSTVFPFGAARCIDCKAPVAIVRRTVEVGCSGPDCLCLQYPHPDPEDPDCPPDHTHAVPDCLYVVVDAEGERHLCEAGMANPLDSLARARENGRSEEALSKQRQHCYPAHAAPVEVLADLPEPRRISEQ